MDKQDELAAVIGKAMPNDLTQPEIDKIAAAVRSFMGSEEAMNAADELTALREALTEIEHAENIEIARRIARAALSATIGEDIGGGRG